tara:strand:+ start:1644 stop:2456 length:813 start_codon:yes stop_codon:yes gene_type:complete
MKNNEDNSINTLLDVVSKLRDPKSGCPWDLKQTLDSIAPFSIEEAYEVVEAVQENDTHKIIEELGDLLFQIVLLSQIAKESKLFNFFDVVKVSKDKMIKRHPHVFNKITSSENEVQLCWEKNKLNEHQESNSDRLKSSYLSQITEKLPALIRAEKIQKRAKAFGFDWKNLSDVFKKVDEERHEVENAIKLQNQKKIKEEIGDFLFTIVNLSRHLNVNSEEALRNANKKFIHRFQKLEEIIIDNGLDILNMSLNELENYWIKIKSQEKNFD